MSILDLHLLGEKGVSNYNIEWKVHFYHIYSRFTTTDAINKIWTASPVWVIISFKHLLEIKVQPCPNDGRELNNFDRPAFWHGWRIGGLKVVPLFSLMNTTKTMGLLTNWG